MFFFNDNGKGSQGGRKRRMDFNSKCTQYRRFPRDKAENVKAQKIKPIRGKKILSPVWSQDFLGIKYFKYISVFWNVLG